MLFNYKILILDDDTLVTSSLKSLLILEGFNDVALFNDPFKALEYLKSNKRDVIISDFMMNDLNGIEFLSEAKKIYPNASMILLTGYADKENAIKAINEVGIYKYIEKPWDNDQLIINIKNAFERSQLINTLESKNIELEKYSNHLEDLVNEKTANIIEMNQKLSAIINNCADGIVIFDSSYKPILINPAAENMFGVSESYIKNKSVSELFSNNSLDWNSIFENNEEKFLRDITIKNVVNGNLISVEISCATIPPSAENESPTFVFVIRDVNIQKNMERMRDDFIATLTHDLRTPSLAAIQTLEYFLNGSLGKLNDKQTLLLSTMKKSSEDMLGLINTLLEVYKYESGKLKLVKTKFNFRDLIEECVNQIMPLCEAKNQTISKNYADIDSKLIFADRNELRRVIINLLGNAVKYTQNDGHIDINAKIEDNDLRVSIKDNGAGIFKKDIPKLFKRFSQGTQDKRSISTGLGLYLSKQIIDAHGGKIWLESDKGKGSEFFFLLLNSAFDFEKDIVWKS